MMLSKRDHHRPPSVKSLPGRLDSEALLGRSQSLAFVPFDDAPELRPLRSTGITQFHRYCEPLRHPERPGHLLTEFRLRIRTLTVGASRVAPDLLVPTCRRHCPGGTATRSRSSCTAMSAFPQSRRSASALVFSRLAQRSLTLRPAGSPGRLATLCIEGSGGFVTSTTAPIATGWSESCQAGLPPAEDRRLSTAHGTPYLTPGGRAA